MSFRQNSFLNNTMYRKTHGIGAGISEMTDPMQCYNLRSWGFTQCRVIYKYDQVDYSFHALDEACHAPIDGTMVVNVCDTAENIEKFIEHPDILVTEINYNGKTNPLRIGAYDYIECGWYDNADGNKNWVNRYFVEQTMHVSYIEPLEEAEDITGALAVENDLFNSHYPADRGKYLRRFHINPDEDFYLLTFKTNDYLVYLASKAGIDPIKRMLAFSDKKFMRCSDILSFIALIKANEKSLELNFRNTGRNYSKIF